MNDNVNVTINYGFSSQSVSMSLGETKSFFNWLAGKGDEEYRIINAKNQSTMLFRNSVQVASVQGHYFVQVNDTLIIKPNDDLE